MMPDSERDNKIRIYPLIPDTKEIKKKSDKPVKIINIDFCQLKNAIESSQFQLVVIRNNRAHFSDGSHFRETHMTSRLP